MTKEILQNHTVLYVEDDVGVRKHFVESLKRYFKHVYEAADAQEALSVYDTKEIDVLISDIDLPKMDGLALVKLIREENETLPIVMLTAYSDREKLLKATELYLVKYLVKPVEPEEFREALRLVAKKLSSKEQDISLEAGYVWSVKKNQIHRNGEEIILLPKEQRLLELLIMCKGQCVSTGEIMLEVWEDDIDESATTDAIKYHITQLRKKLTGLTIRNIYAKGYMLV